MAGSIVMTRRRPGDDGFADPAPPENPEAIRAFDAADAYDVYGTGLYEYAHTLLQDGREAADAVRDMFIAAQHHQARLRERELLHGWLYALLRAECQRRAPAAGADAEPRPAPLLEPRGEWTKRDEARMVLVSALGGLPGDQREIIDLFVRHQLTTIELTRLLGLSANSAVDALARASAALEEAISAVVVARTSPSECPGVGAAEETSPLSGAEVRRLVRHVYSCPTCRDLRPGVISTERLLELLPFAEAPEGLRSEVLLTVTAPDLGATRERVAHRAEPLDERGWPFVLVVERAPEQPLILERARAHRPWPVIGVAAAAVGLIVLLGAMALSLGNAPRMVSSGPETGDLPGGSASGGPAQNTSGGTPRTGTPGVSTSPTKHSPSPTPTRSHSPSPPGHRQPPPPPADGSLSVTGCTMQSGQSSCTITVTAVSGRVRWSVTGTSGAISASGGGSLNGGESAEVVVRRRGLCLIGSGNGSVSFNSGATAGVSWNC